MSDTELSQKCCPGAFPAGAAAPQPRRCRWGAELVLPPAGLEDLCYFWPFMEVLVKTCNLLAFPERQGNTLCAPALLRGCQGSGSTLGDVGLCR